MKALTFHGNHTIQFESISDPKIVHPSDVIVKVHVCAVCGSDLHVYHGIEKGIDHGTAMGHEFTGEIVEVGKENGGLRTGDLVMSPFTTSCGQCFYCKTGLTCRCIHNQLFGWVENGKGLHGGQAEYVRVPMAASTLLKIPDGISLEEGLLLGDNLSTGYFCALQAEVKPKGIYAVVGCGPVGLMAIIGARELGAENIFAIDKVPERLAMAKRWGAIPVEGGEDAIIDTLKNATEGRGVDAVMEAVGTGAAVGLAYKLVRPGGIVSSVGVCNDESIAFSPVEAYNKNLTYKIGRCPSRNLMEKLVPLVASKKYDLLSVFSHRLPLSKGVEAYDVFANKREGCVKVLLLPD